MKNEFASRIKKAANILPITKITKRLSGLIKIHSAILRTTTQ